MAITLISEEPAMQEERYWQAVLERDKTANGIFVYGVRSTGIYCNPSCPSRKPRKEQVLFFTLPIAAEEAGFRACRRCRPDEANGAELHVELVEQTCTYIEEHCEDTITLAILSSEVGMSPFHLQRIFKQNMGITPHQYADACRLRRFKASLRDGDTVTTAMYDAGYGSSSRLYEKAPTQLGMTPNTYRRGGQGMFISFTTLDSPFGCLLVAATTKGICAIYLGETDEQLSAMLKNEYPAADIEHDGSTFGSWVTTLLLHLEGKKPHLDLPLDVQATAFQWSVWAKLQAIPYGETRSYGEIAQALGDSHKSRAVAQACASNPVALLIPCHRVIRSNGDLAGYRWGIERKRRLLQQEQNT